MDSQKVELLAPAGDFACFRAAVNAGADAVYLGGEKFGARAYAGNFSKDEIASALRIAHIFKRKIYLTVNTLVKEGEFAELVPYIAPLYEAGLDGVIVQDMGVLECLSKSFPDLELHASTQMTITSVYGASYLKRLGVSRVVPARELSLDEIKDIKEKTGLEVECFIHGAMCYAYSGQCLFSSILGGRSGNRGRCAGPCRLPYADSRGKTSYPLSLKDMYTLSILPELIQAGIDSFKIEGRMKSPEYVAGVTAMYRKYIDRFLSNPSGPYKVEADDEKLMRELYIRSDICTGYYHRHNGKSMVTLNEPGYSGSSQETIKAIQEKYISKNILLPVTAHAKIRAGECAVLTLSCDGASVTVTGEMAGRAVNRPLDEAEIEKRVGKLGDTCFELADMTVDTDNESFMSVKALNELRRMACIALEDELCRRNRLYSCPKKADNSGMVTVCRENTAMTDKVNAICALTNAVEHVLAANSFSEIHRIYVNSDIFMHTGIQMKNVIRADKEYILVLPHIFRKRSFVYLDEYEKLLKSGQFAGVMVRNFEELEWLNETGYDGFICSDYTVYAWNNASLDFLSAQLDEVTMSLELNKKELGRLVPSSDKYSMPMKSAVEYRASRSSKAVEFNMRLCASDLYKRQIYLTRSISRSFVLYGYIPLMYSANCVQNTLERCIKSDKAGKNEGNTFYHLTDRYKNVFTVGLNCLHCYNILYNTMPLSLHGQLDSIVKKNYNILRLDFSVEDRAQTESVINYYLGLMGKKAGVSPEFPHRDFTNGHYKRGVE